MEIEFEFLFQPGLKFTFELEFEFDLELKSEFAFEVALELEFELTCEKTFAELFIDSSSRVPAKRQGNYRGARKNRR